MEKRLTCILKLIVACLSFGYVAFKIYEQVSEGLSLHINVECMLPFMAAVVMMPVNWLVEARKWQLLTLPYQPLKLARALKSVFVGLSVSLITPNRIGDFAGRISLLLPANRMSGVASSFIGSFAQMLAILLLATVAYCISPFFVEKTILVSFLLVAVSLLALAGFFFIGRMTDMASACRFEWVRKFASAVRIYGFGQLCMVLFLSVVRYAVFATQFLLFLEAFGVNGDLMTMYRNIAFMYACVTVIPTFALAEIGVRGSMALVFIVPVGATASQVLIATIVVWVVNVGLPALIGSFLSVDKTCPDIKRGCSDSGTSSL